METPPHPPPTAPAAPAAPGGPSVPRGRRLRLVLAVAAGVTALLCLGGVSIAFLLYDDATKIDRSAPDVVVDNYLRAFLVNRDDAEAGLFRCKSPAGLAELDILRTEMMARERQFSMNVHVSWSSLETALAGQQATVSTDLRRSVSDGTESLANRWQFGVVDEGGWRVCSATKVG